MEVIVRSSQGGYGGREAMVSGLLVVVGSKRKNVENVGASSCVAQVKYMYWLDHVWKAVTWVFSI